MSVDNYTPRRRERSLEGYPAYQSWPHESGPRLASGGYPASLDEDVRTDTEEHARKAAKVRQLTDPLGSKGFRRTRGRVERETRARGRVYAVSIATFAASFGLLVYSNNRNVVDDHLRTAAGAISAQADRLGASSSSGSDAPSGNIFASVSTMVADVQSTPEATPSTQPNPRRPTPPRRDPGNGAPPPPAQPPKAPPPAATRTKSS